MNWELFAKVLSEILSEKYQRDVEVTIERSNQN